MQPRFGMIEVALDAAQNFVVDDVFVAQLNDRPALHIESVLLQALVGGGDQPIRAISASARGVSSEIVICTGGSSRRR